MMILQEPEIVELGLARDLIQTTWLESSLEMVWFPDLTYSPWWYCNEPAVQIEQAIG